MRARWRIRLLALAVVALASLARADAQPTQYDLFDGGFLIIRDKWTGLTWQRTLTPTQPLTFLEAASHCRDLVLDAGQRADPTRLWRVPSYKELLTLVDESPHLEYEVEAGQNVQKAIDANAFPKTPTVPVYDYWTSSLDPHTTAQMQQAYLVDFGTGTGASQHVTYPAYVRCVHD